jgi:hypothetical protein
MVSFQTNANELQSTLRGAHTGKSAGVVRTPFPSTRAFTQIPLLSNFAIIYSLIFLCGSERSPVERNPKFVHPYSDSSHCGTQSGIGTPHNLSRDTLEVCRIWILPTETPFRMPALFARLLNIPPASIRFFGVSYSWTSPWHSHQQIPRKASNKPKGYLVKNENSIRIHDSVKPVRNC